MRHLLQGPATIEAIRGRHGFTLATAPLELPEASGLGLPALLQKINNVVVAEADWLGLRFILRESAWKSKLLVLQTFSDAVSCSRFCKHCFLTRRAFTFAGSAGIFERQSDGTSLLELVSCPMWTQTAYPSCCLTWFGAHGQRFLGHIAGITEEIRSRVAALQAILLRVPSSKPLRPVFGCLTLRAAVHRSCSTKSQWTYKADTRDLCSDCSGAPSLRSP